MLCTLFIMLGECYVFYFYFYFDLAPPPVLRSAVKMSVNQLIKNQRPTWKIKYYKICDIKYGIRF